MIGLEAWLAREGQRQRSSASLAAALLLGRRTPYAWKRLGPVLFTLCLRTALHGLELYLLSLALPVEYLRPVLGYRALFALAGAWHWGALEPLRAAVRTHVRDHKPRLAQRAIARWLSFGSLGTVALCVSVAARCAWAGLRGDGWSLFDCYLLACALRLSCEVYARTLHAGIFALRRVYRPWWSLVGADAVSLIVLIVGFDALGAWCLPISLFAGGVLDAGSSVVYARSAYRSSGMRVPRATDLTPPPLAASLRGLCAGLAYAATQVDGLVLLMLLRTERRLPEAALALAPLYFVLRPSLGFSAHWVRSFYFDVSRLEYGAGRVLRAHALRYLRQVGRACALLSAASVWVCVLQFWPEWRRPELLVVLPFVWARAVYAQRQLEAFVSGRYGMLLACAGLLGCGLAVSSWLWASGPMLLLSATGLLALSSRCLPAPLSTAGRELALSSLPEWLSALARSSNAQLAVLQLAGRCTSQTQVARALAAVDPSWKLAPCGNRQLVLLSTSERELSLPELLGHCAGTLSAVHVTARGTGREALLDAQQRALLPHDLSLALDSQEQSGNAQARAFAVMFPEGTLLDCRSGRGRLSRSSAWTPAQLHELVTQLVLACRQREHTRRSRLPSELAVFAPGGDAQLIFVVPRASPGFAEFRARVRQATLHASWHGALAACAPQRGGLPDNRVHAIRSRTTRVVQS